MRAMRNMPLPVESVVSIERLEQVNPIPHLPEYMLGSHENHVVNWFRFSISNKFFTENSAKDNANARVVVVQTENLYIGLLVLDAKEILDIPENIIDIFWIVGIFKNAVFHDSCKFENRMITVVDAEILSQSLAGWMKSRNIMQLEQK